MIEKDALINNKKDSKNKYNYKLEYQNDLDNSKLNHIKKTTTKNKSNKNNIKNNKIIVKSEYYIDNEQIPRISNNNENKKIIKSDINQEINSNDNLFNTNVVTTDNYNIIVIYKLVLNNECNINNSYINNLNTKLLKCNEIKKKANKNVNNISKKCILIKNNIETSSYSFNVSF